MGLFLWVADMDWYLWLALGLGFGFLAYLFYTGQFKWVLGVARNVALGVVGIFVLNFFLARFGLAVGVNPITALTVGVLGVPGFVLLYASQLLL